MIATQQRRCRPRLVLAGCASGPPAARRGRPLSPRHAFLRAGLPDPEIVATDVSPAARAAPERPPQFEIQRGLPVRRMMTWFDTVGRADWAAKPELVRKLQFLPAQPDSRSCPGGIPDIILCRNDALFLAARGTPQGVRQPGFGDARPGGLLALGAE